MSTFHDEEFGEITIRRSARTQKISIRIAPNGSLRASLPIYAPVILLKRLINQSRDDLRKLTEKYVDIPVYSEGMQLGKSHKLVAMSTKRETTKVERADQNIVVYLAPHDELESETVRQMIQKEYIKLLRIEAKAYLPRKLAALAHTHGFSYERVRFSHATGRWGSCSSRGTISLNIALMKLPHELIDYVLVHELCHTKEMNHSKNFWKLVEACDPLFKEHRKAIKTHHPYV